MGQVGTTELASGGGGSGVTSFNGRSGVVVLLTTDVNTVLSQGANVTISPTGTSAVTMNPAGLSTIDHTTLGGTTPAAGTFTALSATASANLSPSGTVTINPTTVSGMDNVVIGATTAKAATFTTVTSPVYTAVGAVSFGTAGSSTITFSTAGGTQAQITNTASAAANITMTGAASGANPKLGTTTNNLVLGSGSALSTSATTGFPCIPGCVGVPTGTAVAVGGGAVALVVDTSDGRLYGSSSGGTWVNLTGSGGGAGAAVVDLVINAGCRVGARADAGVVTNIPVAGTIAVGGVDMTGCGVTGSGAAVSAGTITRQSGNSFGSTGFSVQMTGLTTTGVNATVTGRYRMESEDADAYVGQTASFSVIAQQNTGSTQSYTLAVNKANAQNNFSAVTNISVSGGQSVPSGTPTTITLAGVSMGACGNGIEIVAAAVTGAVTTKNFDFTDFTAPISASAYSGVVPVRRYADDLADCQRYLPRNSSNSGNAVYNMVGGGTSTTVARLVWNFLSPVLSPITGILHSTSSGFNVFDLTTFSNIPVASIAVGSGSGSASAVRLDFTVAAGVTSGGVTLVDDGGAGATYIIGTGAELF